MHRLCTILGLVCVLLIAVISAGCGQESAARLHAEHERILQERMARDETAIRAASAGWSKAAQSKDLEKSLTFFADNAIMLSPKSHICDSLEKTGGRCLESGRRYPQYE